MNEAPPSDGVLAHVQTLRISGSVSRDEALSLLADSVVEAGWAKAGYRTALLAREAAYPTGLHAQGLDIAIPHADAEWTLVPSMVIGILEEPAVFEAMGGQGPQVLARIIFLLVIPDADAHVDFLRALSGFIEHPHRLEEFSKAEDLEMLLEYLRAELQQGAA